MFSLKLCRQIVAQCLQLEADLAAAPTIPVAQIDWRHLASNPMDGAQTIRTALDHVETGRWAALLVSKSVLSSPSNAEHELRRYLLFAHRLAGVIALPTSLFAKETGDNTAILIVQKLRDGIPSHEGPRTERVRLYTMADTQTVLSDLYAAYVRAGATAAAQAYTVGKTDSSRHTAARRLLGNRLSALNQRFKQAANVRFADDTGAAQALRPLLRNAQAQAELVIDKLIFEIERSHLKKARTRTDVESAAMDESVWERRIHNLVETFAALDHHDSGTHSPGPFIVAAHWSVPVRAIETHDFNLSPAHYRSEAE